MRDPYFSSRLRGLVAALTYFAGSALHAAETITITSNTIIRSTANRPVGINMNYLLDDEASRPAGSPRTLAQGLNDMKAKFLRFPGGEKSDNYIWTTVSSSDGALVTTSTAIPSPLAPRVAEFSYWPGNGAYASGTTGRFSGPNLDFDEFMAVCQANGATPVIVVAYDEAREITGRTTGPTIAQLVASAAAWVKYANVTKGHNIRYWSIGNESWFRSGMTAATYSGHVNQFATAMRAVDPTIKIGAHGNSSTWFNTVIANASSSIDWLDVHDYPTYNWLTGYDEFRLNNKNLTPDVNNAIASIAAASLPADRTRLTVAVTETNTIDWATNGWAHVNDLGHALVNFDLIGQQLSKPKLEFTQLWNTRWVNNTAFKAGSGTNSVLNPGFETDLTNWLVSGSAVITTSSVFSGTKALQGNGGSFVSQNINMGAGVYGTLSGFGRTSNAGIWSGIGIDYLSSSGTKIDGVSIQIKGTSYSKLSVPFTTPVGTTKVQVWLYVSSGTTAFLDQVAVSDRVEPEIFDAFAPDNSYLPVGRSVALWGQFLRDNLVQSSRSANVISYASRSTTDQAMTVWLLNKQTGPVDVNLTLNGYTPSASAQAWRFAGNGPSDFQPTYAALPAVSVPGSTLPITLPQTSITVLVFSQAAAAPAAPTALLATAVSTSQINLSWTDNSSNESGFKLERSPDGTTGWTQVVATAANATGYAHTGLAAGQTVFYRVRATSTQGDSPYSNITNAKAFTGVQSFRTTYSLAADGSQDQLTPAGDGVPNILKYAFNMLGSGSGQTSTLATPNNAVLSPTGSAGLPLVNAGTGADADKLQITYIRRKASTNPGFTYAVVYSDTLATDSWAANVSAVETVTSIDTTFERVTVTAPPATANKNFGRVRVDVSSP